MEETLTASECESEDEPEEDDPHNTRPIPFIDEETQYVQLLCYLSM